MLLPSILNWTPKTPTSSLALAVILTELPLTVALFAGAVKLTLGAVGLLTVTTALAVIVAFAALRAVAVMECVPLVTVLVSQLTLNGAVTSSLPTFTLSTLNCTPTVLVAVAEIACVPDTVDPLAGVLIATEGDGATFWTLTDQDEVAVKLPVFLATAEMVWLPLVSVLVSRLTLYGAVLSSAPTFVLSTLNCTPAIPLVSLAVAAKSTTPVTVDPLAGAVKLTVGGEAAVVDVRLKSSVCSHPTLFIT